MQNDGYQQAMNEIRALRSERKVYRSALEGIAESRGAPNAIRDFARKGLRFGDDIHAEIPVHEAVEVTPEKV